MSHPHLSYSQIPTYEDTTTQLNDFQTKFITPSAPNSQNQTPEFHRKFIPPTFGSQPILYPNLYQTLISTYTQCDLAKRDEFEDSVELVNIKKLSTQVDDLSKEVLKLQKVLVLTINNSQEANKQLRIESCERSKKTKIEIQDSIQHSKSCLCLSFTFLSAIIIALIIAVILKLFIQQ